MLILRIAVLSFLLAGLSFSYDGNQLSAQATLSSDLYSEPTGLFAAPAEASARIDNAIAPIKDLLSNLTPGTPAYQEAWAKYTYYNTAQNYFLNGKTVRESIVLALWTISTDEYNVPKGGLAILKQQLVNLLKI
ncbi:MAG: hypothetical protein M3R25_10010 [Bacteroidota bacterium]|nr:hypothetical protein [Bacteroidota bacterium]